MYIAYKFRMYPTDEQKIIINFKQSANCKMKKDVIYYRRRKEVHSMDY